MKRDITIMVALRCAECDAVQTIRRKRNKLKKVGHRKHLYCVKCEERTLHVEIGLEERM